MAFALKDAFRKPADQINQFLEANNFMVMYPIGKLVWISNVLRSQEGS